MNWFKKATLTMNPLELDWDATAEELKVELGRNPTPEETQQRVLQKYWNKTDILEQNKCTDYEL